MTEPLIPGGYILLSRKLIESEIWNKPPLYLKIWIYFLSKAQHQNYKGLKRGQLWTSIPEIQEACSWYVGYRKETPTKDQVYAAIRWFRNPTGKISRNPYEGNYEHNANTPMITTTKATQGMLVTIDNYCFYQDPKNYEANTGTDDEKATNPQRGQQPPNNINKNDKNDKNDKEDIYILTESEERFLNALSQIKNYPLDRKKDLEMYKRLGEKYPQLDINEAIEQWEHIQVRQSLEEKSNPQAKSIWHLKIFRVRQMFKGVDNNGISANKGNNVLDITAKKDSIKKDSLFRKKLR